MRELRNTQRRRRLRIIKAKDARSEERIRSVGSSSENPANLTRSRETAEQNRKRLAADCQAQIPVRLRIEHPAQESLQMQMGRAHLLIGSDPSCDIQLDHAAVHPQHAALQWIDGHLFYLDLSPKTANDAHARSAGHWVDHRPISIGPFQLFREDPQVPSPPAASPLERSPVLTSHVPQLALQFLGVEQSDNKWPINRLLTMVGRGAQCKLRLNHPSMPHVQACLIRTEQSCWLIDVVRAGTTGVNGRAIRLAPISVGDVLQLGPFRVEVVETTFAPLPAPPPPGAKEENPPRNKVKLFAPGNSDLALPQRAGARKTATPPKSASLVDSSDSSSAITEISRNSSPANVAAKRAIPATTILETGRPAQLKMPSRGIDPPHTHHTPEKTETGSSDSLENASIPFPQESPRAEEKSASRMEERTSPHVLDETPSDVGPAISPVVSPAATTSLTDNVDEFLRGHLSQLAQLQSNLDRLKQVCTRPSRRAMSKRVRAQLETSLQETIQTQQQLQESVSNFAKSLKQ
ncbi:FHA domain-containing protein [Schlesneria sp. DSM 10557]|uniref:FHA domain-containing protein n=1 Tax=Schlesneria sp. DSM 10557 TaxID=3044399 RepID=UPI00359F9073